MLVLAACGGSSDSVEEPWPDPPANRPVVDLAFTVEDSLARAAGTERVTFTPDQQICDVVFRAWPNKPATAATGNSLVVSRIVVAGRSLPVSVEQAGAPEGSPGTLVSARLPQCSPAGRAVTVDLTFSLTLGDRTDERVGRSDEAQIAWLGTAFPLLAWAEGEGWVRDPAVPVTGDLATSEAFRLQSLQVTAPSRYAVAGVGDAEATSPGTTADTTVHRFSADSVRDVTVTVGAIDFTEFDADGVQVTLALPRAGSRADAGRWEGEISRGIDELEQRFGPMPYPDLWVSVLPGVTEGVEYPGALQFGDIDPTGERWLVLHELAHEWFYALVGNNQARDPWLDEAFATYAQERVEPVGTAEERRYAVEGAVGESLGFFADARRSGSVYVDTVYGLGGEVLLEARRADGDPAAFDAAVLAYLRTHAHRIARPQDVERALQGLPQAVDMLRAQGAFD